MNALSVKNITKSFGGSKVLADASLTIGKGEIHALVGESGSGKTTLMRIVAGLETADDGEVWIHEKEETHTVAKKRNVGLVFQDYALFPHMTVEQNIVYGLKKLSKEAKKQRVQELLELIHLPGIEKKYPHQLSGGQQQRVALARSLAPKPSLMLLDEPFSNLDPIRKNRLRQAMRDMVDEFKTTVLIVTHDMCDARKIADHITVLEKGKVVQSDTLECLCCKPANEYVKSLLED